MLMCRLSVEARPLLGPMWDRVFGEMPVCRGNVENAAHPRGIAVYTLHPKT